jgi:hypothetical protein
VSRCKHTIDKRTVRLQFTNAARSPCLQAASADSLAILPQDPSPSGDPYVILLAIVVCILLATIAYLSCRIWTTQTVSRTEKRALEEKVEGLKRELAQKTRDLEAAETELQRIRPKVQTLEREIEEAQEGMMIALVEARAAGVVARPERPERHDTRHMRALMLLSRVHTTGGRSGLKFHEKQCHHIENAKGTPQEMTWADAVNRGLPLCIPCERRIEQRAMAQGLKVSA